MTDMDDGLQRARDRPIGGAGLVRGCPSFFDRERRAELETFGELRGDWTYEANGKGFNPRSPTQTVILSSWAVLIYLCM